jgi:maltose alpha-D-glucosyltransferase/alpha-amylase
MVRTEQSNSSIIFGDRLILKLFRRIDEGINPEVEIGHFLTEKTSFTNIAQVAGSLEYTRNRTTPISVAVLQQFVPNEGDAWNYTLDALGGYFDYVATREESRDDIPLPAEFITNLLDGEPPDLAIELIGYPYLETVRLLGQRTAEMHLALASEPTNPAFAPEPLSPLDWRSVYQSLRTRASEVFLALRKSQETLPEFLQADAQELINQQDALFEHMRSMLSYKISVMRTRCHGDYHLGQVLYTGSDFVIIDFEGEPARTLADRRIKRSPLRDVAGMLRSFNYAAATAMLRHAEATGALHQPGQAALEMWAQFWEVWVSVVFLQEYLRVAEGAPFITHNRDELGILLEVYLFDKAIYELGYELNNRPEWAHIPLRSILQMLAARI